VKKHFGPLQGTGEGRPNYTTREPATTGERRFTVRKPGEAAVILAGYRVPACARRFGGRRRPRADARVGQFGPLHEAIVGRASPRLSRGSMTLRYASPFFVIASVPKDKDADAAEAAILDFIEKKAAR